MSRYNLDSFLASCRERACDHKSLADLVCAIAPSMESLLSNSDNFLTEQHVRHNLAHYARNPIFISPQGDLSLYAIVWLPGQWTPIHDHGTWGVVGVVSGALEERNFMCPQGQIRRDEGIRLKRGGTVVLKPGSVSTFVPNPDHIHMTGVPDNRGRALTLHLYGRDLNRFHVYDVDHGSRVLVDAPYA